MSDVAANTSSPSPGTVTKPFHASTLGQALTKTLVTSKERQLYKKLPEPSSAYPIDFASSDYLSFTHVPELRAQFLHKLSISPSVFGSGGSRTVINGGSHAMLENRLKAFFGYEAAVLCNSGYDANLAFFEVVPQKGDIIVFDEKVCRAIHGNTIIVCMPVHSMAPSPTPMPNASIHAAIDNMHSSKPNDIDHRRHR